MKRAALLVLTSLLLTTVSKADKTLNYPKKDPFVSFTVPDDWKPKVTGGSLFVTSPDGGDVIVEVMMMEAGIDDDAAAVKEAKSTVDQDFKGLKLEKSDATKANGLVVTLLGGEGKDKSGEAHINMALIKHPEAKHQILFSLIAAKENAAKYGAACGAMMNSISAVLAGGAPDKAPAAAAVQTYSYPDKKSPTFSMELPADWKVEGDDKGAWIVSADKQFTLSVVPIDMEHIEDGMVNITKQVSAKYDEVVWNEGKEPKTHIDEATGSTLISSEGVAKGGGFEHKLGVYQFAKKGAKKFFVLSAWSPLKLAEANGEAALKAFMSVKLN